MLIEYLEKVNPILQEILDKELAHKLGVDKRLLGIIERSFELSNSLLVKGGKRLRGSLAYHGYLMHGGKKKQEMLKTSLFIELIHAFLLIHDDIMDIADLRRGFTTLHKVYEKEFLTIADSGTGAKHFGESMAVTVGDVLDFFGTKMLIEANFPAERKIKALSKTMRNLMDVGYGQMMDIYGEITGADEEFVMVLHLYKTGYYTYETPLQVGAILAGADKEDLKVMTDYALPGGIAFQLVDDIIDMFGDYKKTGKKIGTDIKQGKNTLLTVKAYEKANAKQKKMLDFALGNRSIKKRDIEDVKQILIDTGSVEYSRNLANKLLDKSTRAIKKAKKKYHNEGMDFMIGINEYMKVREV